MPLTPVSCHSLGEQRTHQEEREKNERGSGFTVITEQKAAEVRTNVNLHLEKDTHSLTAQVHELTAQIATSAPQRSVKEGEADTNKTEATRTAMTSSNRDKDNVTSSDQEQATGILIKFTF